MPKKKGINAVNKQLHTDFTLNDYANSHKPYKVKKPPTPEVEPVNTPEVSWDQLPDDNEEFDLVNQVNADGTMNLVCIKKRKKAINESKYNEYPEFVWYEISRRIDPEDIGRFAGINKTCYAITQQKSFWLDIYEKYCKHHPDLPERLRIEDGPKTYGMKTRIIRALYYTHDFFLKKVMELGMHDSKPHDMIKRRCVNMWVRKSKTHWALFFKFKKLPQQQAAKKVDYDFIEELGRLDANPEIDNQVLQVNCEFFYEVPPLMGMTLTSVKLGLSKTLRSHKLQMGFNSGTHVAKNVLPEHSLSLDTVISIMVIDWWHPNYPHFLISFTWENRAREREEDRDAPVLDRDFFAPHRKYQRSNGSVYAEHLQLNHDRN